jgi:muramoyltetrapeptide carboxypeptidase
MSGEEHIIFTFNDKQILQGGQQAEGRLIGGNLSIVQYLPSLLGMGYFDGALLCIEDCGEELSRIDRMFSYMKAVGAFSKISGLLCGDFSALSDTGRPYEKTIQQIIMDNCGDLDIPILSDLAFGHGALNSCIPLGLKAVLNGSEKTISLK